MATGRRTRKCIRGFVWGSWSFLFGFIVAFSATMLGAGGTAPSSFQFSGQLVNAVFATMFQDILNTVMSIGVSVMFLGSLVVTLSVRYYRTDEL